MKVCDAISGARKRAGLTQEQLAAKVYVTRQAVSRWENGDSEPSVDMRKLLASVLNMPAEEAVSFMGAVLPTLKRWRSAGNRGAPLVATAGSTW